jgi:hypothetical protein
MKAWRKVCGPIALVIPARRATRLTIRGRAVTVQTVFAAARENRSLGALADR